MKLTITMYTIVMRNEGEWGGRGGRCPPVSETYNASVSRTITGFKISVGAPCNVSFVQGHDLYDIKSGS